MTGLADPPKRLPERLTAVLDRAPRPRWVWWILMPLCLAACVCYLTGWLSPDLRALIPISETALNAAARILGGLAVFAVWLPRLIDVRDDPHSRPAVLGLTIFFGLVPLLQIVSLLKRWFPPWLAEALPVLTLGLFVGGLAVLFYVTVIRPGGKRGWLARNP